jgi:hypothetical protein
VSGIIRVAILGDASSLEAAAVESSMALGKLEGKTTSAGQKFVAFGKKAAMAAGVVAVAMVAIAIKNGDALNEAEDQLKRALKNQGVATKSMSAQMDPVLKKLEKWGFTNKDVTESLTVMTRGGVKWATALKYQSLVADIAKAKHIDLSKAALLVTKATQGQSRALKSLGIDTAIANGSAKSQQTAMLGVAKAQEAVRLVEEKIKDGRLKGQGAADAAKNAAQNLMEAQRKLNAAQHGGADIAKLLAHRLGGTAATAAESLHGKMEVLHAKFTDFTAHLGQKLIPILLTVISFFEKHTVVGKVLAGVIGGVLLLATLSWVASLHAAALALFEVYAPLLLVLGIAALVYLGMKQIDPKPLDRMARGWEKVKSALQRYHDRVVVFGEKFQRFADRMVTGWQRISDAFNNFCDRMVTGWHRVVDAFQNFADRMVQGVANIRAFVSDTFNSMVDAVWGAMVRAKDAVGGVIDWIVGAVVGIAMRVAGGIGAVANVIAAPFKVAFDAIKRLWNDTIGSIHIHEGVGPFHLDFDGPRLHGGGVFNSGMGEGLALLKDGEGVFTPAQMAALGAATGGGSGRGGSTIINLPAGVDPDAVVQAQLRYDRRNGRV